MRTAAGSGAAERERRRLQLCPQMQQQRRAVMAGCDELLPIVHEALTAAREAQTDRSGSAIAQAPVLQLLLLLQQLTAMYSTAAEELAAGEELRSRSRRSTRASRG
jgi:hypothetical protein